MMKLKNVLLKIIALGSIVGNLCGCSFMHVHTYNTFYQYDETMHWQICEKCGQNLNVDTHAFNDFNDTCLFCGYHDSIVVVSEDGLMTDLTPHGKKKYEIDLPTNVKLITKDALKNSSVTRINIPKEFVGYYAGAFDYNNINIVTDEEKVTWTYENGIYYKHNVLEEYEAIIDEKCFKTLKEAIESVQTDDTTITIVKEDLAINETLYIDSIINIKSYYDTTNLNCNFEIAGSGILNIDSSINFSGSAQLILVPTKEELDDEWKSVYKSGAIAFIDRETKPENVYVEYVRRSKQAVGFGDEAVGSKQVVNNLLVIPVPQYAYGAFAFSTDYKSIMGLSPYGNTISELHITNVVKGVDAEIASYAFAVWTDIKINIAVVDDTHITYYQSKGSFSSLYIDDGITAIGYRAFSNEMTDDVFHEVRIMLSLLCPLKTVHIGDSVTLIHSNAFTSSLGLEEVYGGRGLTEIGENAFYECLNLSVVDFSEAFKLKKINKYAFGYCDHFVYLSLPRDNWNINGQVFVPHQFTPEVAAYHAVHADGDKVWSRTVNGTICYTKSLGKDGCGKFNNAVYTYDLQTALNNCCDGGWVYIMEANDDATKHIQLTNVTKSLNLVAYDTAKDISIGSEENGLIIAKNHYLTLDNITPLGNILLNCDFEDTGLAYKFYNIGSFGVKADNHEVYPNIHVYFNNSAINSQVEARYTSAAFAEGIDYMVFGLLDFFYRYSGSGYLDHLKGQILFETVSSLIDSITKIVLENPIYDNDEFTVKRVDTTNELFMNKKNLKYLKLSDSITGIGIYAFFGCTNLEKVIFGNNIQHILSNAFQFCTKLKMVDLGMGNNLVQIDDNVFSLCPSLNYIDFGGNVADWVVDSASVTITADQISDPYDAAEVVKQYSQYDWTR